MKSSIHSVPNYDRRLILAVGPRRAAGLTTTAAATVDWLLCDDTRPQVAAFDAQTHGWPLSRIFSEPEARTCPVQAIDWRAASKANVLDRIGRALCAERSPATVLLVDCGAVTAAQNRCWVKADELFEMAEYLGVRVTYVVLIDAAADSIKCAASLFETVCVRGDYLVVYNERTAAFSDSAWRDAPERDRALFELGAKEALFPHLPYDVRRYLAGGCDDRPHSLAQAAEQDRDPFVGERALALWRHWSAQLEGARKYLVPAQTGSPG